jgi:hypothetical protein
MADQEEILAEYVRAEIWGKKEEDPDVHFSATLWCLILLQNSLRCRHQEDQKEFLGRNMLGRNMELSKLSRARTNPGRTCVANDRAGYE